MVFQRRTIDRRQLCHRFGNGYLDDLGFCLHKFRQLHSRRQQPRRLCHQRSRDYHRPQSVNYFSTAKPIRPRGNNGHNCNRHRQQLLSYQWLYNGTNLPGATSVPWFFNVLVSQSGTYSVTVSNSFGTVTSSNATLTVTAISIVGQPQNQSVLGGATVNFSISANGQQPFAYQWLYNGTNLPGATSNPLVLTNVLVSQSGTYSVTVTNSYGTVSSSNATLTVAALSFTAQPTNRITWPNGPATFKVNVSGTPPFTFDWQCNGVDVRLRGYRSNILILTNVPLSQFGSYHVIASKRLRQRGQ